MPTINQEIIVYLAMFLVPDVIRQELMGAHLVQEHSISIAKLASPIVLWDSTLLPMNV
jgi:hypothetical protein